MKKIALIIGLALVAGITSVNAATNQVPDLITAAGITFPTNEVPPSALPTPTVVGGLQEIWSAATSSTNWLVAAYALYAPGLGNKFGGGVSYFYLVNQYLMGGVRFDYVNGNFWMPSGNATLQVPLHPLTKLAVISWIPSWIDNLQVTPFAYAGIGIPLSGAVVGSITLPGAIPKDNNGDPTAIIGEGLALKVYSPSSGRWNISAVGDRETWSGFAGAQWRFGLAFHYDF